MSARDALATSGAARFSSGRGYDNTAGTFKFDPSLPELPALSSSDEKVSLLVRVWSLGTPFALSATGDYQVDWGDGTTTNYTSGTTAEHTIDYDAAGLANTDAPCTFTASTNTVNRTNHGYENGDPVRFFNIVSTTGLISGAAYRVINATANTFQVALKATGSAMSLTNDGSAKLLPYKVALVHLTPQSGSSLTSVNLSERPSALYSGADVTHQALNIEISLPNAQTGQSITLGRSSPVISLRHLQRVAIRNIGQTTSFDYLLRNCFSLASFVCTADTSNVTGFRQLAYSCTRLTSFPELDYSSATDLFQGFLGCLQLRYIEGSLNTSNCTNLAQLFNNCQSLNPLPALDTSAATDLNNMFLSCYAAREVPDLDLSSCLNASGMFSSMYNLRRGVVLKNSSSVTNWSNLYNNCMAVETLPWFDTSGGQNFQNFINQCYSLRTIPQFDYSSATSLINLLPYATSLDPGDPNVIDVSAHSGANLNQSGKMTNSVDHIPYLGNDDGNGFLYFGFSALEAGPLTYPHLESAGTSAQYTFYNSHRAEVFPAYDFSACTNTERTFMQAQGLVELRGMDLSASTNANLLLYNSYSLQRIVDCTLPSVSFSVRSTSLSAAALNEIYTALPTVTSATITVSFTPGASSDDPSIATAKGWTVSG